MPDPDSYFFFFGFSTDDRIRTRTLSDFSENVYHRIIPVLESYKSSSEINSQILCSKTCVKLIMETEGSNVKIVCVFDPYKFQKNNEWKKIRKTQMIDVLEFPQSHKDTGCLCDDDCIECQYLFLNKKTVCPCIEFPITAYNEDIITQPLKSLLVINEKLSVKNKDGVNESINFEKINFLNIGIPHIFNRIDYFISDSKIDSIRKSGITTTMKGLVSFERDFQYNNAGWKINARKNTIINENGYFSACIPLSIIMGYFEDYKQFLYRVPQKLIFNNVSKNYNNALIIKKTDVMKDKSLIFEMKDIVWRLPHIKFSIEYETRIRKEILSNTNFEINFRRWLYQSISFVVVIEFTWDIPVSYAKTKYVLIAFQNNRDNKKYKDNSQFDFLNLENIQQFKVSYYGKKCEPLVDYAAFLTKYPIISIDCSHQPNVIKESLINIRTIFNWHEAVSQNTAIHFLLIMDDKTIFTWEDEVDGLACKKCLCFGCCYCKCIQLNKKVTMQIGV
ncbi:hypothetical protein PGB90_004400 [Kerria lacca]